MIQPMFSRGVMRRKTFVLFAVSVVAFFQFVSTTVCGAMSRTALVIGNGRYQTGPLKNPLNDARDMAAALERLGFAVTLVTDAGLRDMEKALETFGKSLKTAGGAGLFYYAGHGMQVDGVNYLIPMDASIEKDTDLKFEALHLERVLDELAAAGNALNFVLLDACRDNPFSRSTRSGSRGLSFVGQAPSGTFISYSTGANQTAKDGDGRNSPYTAALLRNIEVPGLTVEEVFKNVRAQLRRETGQVPWELSSLEGRFYFKAPEGARLYPDEKPGPSHSIFTSPVTGARFVLVKAGSFAMGSDPDEPGRSDDEVRHTVKISRPFYMQITEVTQGQWKTVMGSNPSYFRNGGPDGPVEQVSWTEAVQFVKKLNELEKTTRYSLPSEAQWEYAARGGTKTTFYTGACLSTDEANYNGTYNLTGCPEGGNRRTTLKTGGFLPNPFGLHDMHGNVQEWTADWKAAYPKAPVTDPDGPRSGSIRVARGGSWQDSARYCRSACRNGLDPATRSPNLGFRLVRLP